MKTFEEVWEKGVAEINKDRRVERILDIGQRGRGAASLFPSKTFETVNINAASNPTIVADAHETGLPRGSAGAILSLSLLEHCHSPHIAVQEMERLLMPGGYILVTVPFMHPYHGGYEDGVFWPDYWRFTEDGVRHLFRNFDIELGSDGGMFLAASMFVPAKFKRLERWLQPVFRVLERCYPHGKSRHSYVIFGRKL
jgi:SAM-dependent methyltransferase